ALTRSRDAGPRPTASTSTPSSRAPSNEAGRSATAPLEPPIPPGQTLELALEAAQAPLHLEREEAEDERIEERPQEGGARRERVLERDARDAGAERAVDPGAREAREQPRAARHAARDPLGRREGDVLGLHPEPEPVDAPRARAEAGGGRADEASLGEEP